MGTYEFYLDESYNSHLFCVGGFLAPPEMWTRIADLWRARIEYERRRSAIKRFPPISRYHATDCANLKREFDEGLGWDVPRQIRFTKRLCEILGSSGPCGIAIGGRISDIKRYLGGSDHLTKESLYDLCLRMSLLLIAGVMRDRFPGTKVKVVHDHSKIFGRVAKSSFESLRADESAGGLEDLFTEVASADSRECVPLQSADFLAYEAMRQFDGIRRGSEYVRKSLQALIGTEIPLHISQFTDSNFDDMRRMLDNKANARPIDDGIRSGLSVMASRCRPSSGLL